MDLFSVPKKAFPSLAFSDPRSLESGLVFSSMCCGRCFDLHAVTVAAVDRRTTGVNCAFSFCQRISPFPLIIHAPEEPECWFAFC